MADKFKLTVYIDNDVAKALKHLAVDKGKTVSEVVNDILRGAGKWLDFFCHSVRQIDK